MCEQRPRRNPDFGEYSESFVYLRLQINPQYCPNGGIGRREGLKILCPLKTCRFDPGSGHQADGLSAAGFLSPEEASQSSRSLPDFGPCYCTQSSCFYSLAMG